MCEPIFARTRYEYTSYSDFWKLVELSKFETCYVDQMDLESDQIYITSPVNGEHRPHVSHRRSTLKSAQQARIVTWMLERPVNTDSASVMRSQLRTLAEDVLKFSEAVWISDRYVASIEPRFTYVELGSHPEFSAGPKHPPQHDVAHMSCSVPRRDAIFSQLSKSMRVAPNAWGSQRDQILRETRAMVNVHQDESKICEPLRIAVAAAYKLAYLTEECHDVYPLVDGVTCFSAPYGLLQDAIHHWTAGGDLVGMGERLYDRLCVKSDFRKGVMNALDRTFPV